MASVLKGFVVKLEWVTLRSLLRLYIWFKRLNNFCTLNLLHLRSIHFVTRCILCWISTSWTVNRTFKKPPCRETVNKRLWGMGPQFLWTSLWSVCRVAVISISRLGQRSSYRFMPLFLCTFKVKGSSGVETFNWGYKLLVCDNGFVWTFYVILDFFVKFSKGETWYVINYKMISRCELSLLTCSILTYFRSHGKENNDE